MNIKAITGGFIVGCIVVIIGYDIWAVLQGGIDATISAMIQDAAHDYPIIAFAAGVLCGHFFWPVRKEKV